jgi:uncharacterized protein DUF1800
MALRLSNVGWLVPIALSAVALAARAAPAPLSPHELALLNRITWGQSESAATELQALGVRAWLERQLRPRPAEPASGGAQAQIDALPIASAPMADLVVRLDAQIKAANKLTDPDQKKAAQQAYQQAMTELGREAATRSLLRDLYSPDQLQADDLVLAEPLQRPHGQARYPRHGRRLRGPGHPAPRPGTLPRPSGGDAETPGHAALPR